MRRQSQNPGYLAMKREQEEERQRRVAEWKRAEVPLVEALRSAGVPVNSVWDLHKKSAMYPSAFPILLEHLQRPYPDAVREGIAYALATPEAKFGWDAIRRAYEADREQRSKDALAVALAAAVDDETIGDLISLVRDARNGASRILMVDALARSKDPRAQAALAELRSDPELTKQVDIVQRRKQKSVSGHAGHDHFVPSSETSMNFDAEDVKPFLEELSKVIGGFGGPEIARVVQAVERLAAEEETSMRFEVQHQGHAVPLEIRIFMDDADAPDLYFLSPSPSLVREIGALLSATQE